MTPQIKKTRILLGLQPFENTRYAISLDDVTIGYVSKYYYDGIDHWYIWSDSGLRSEQRSMNRGIETMVKWYMSNLEGRR